MKWKSFLAGSFFLVFMSGCSKDDNPINPPPDSNILLNTSFEKNGNPDLEGWTISVRPLAEIINDAPSGGGTYCLKLSASDPEGGMGTITIPAANNKTNYKFSFWGKTTQASSTAYFDLLRNGNVEKRSEINISDTVWTQYSVIDTFQVMNGDSIRIILQERFTPLQLFESHFDLVKVETTD